MLTLFLRSLVERGLDLSQGVLVILDGGKGLRAAVRTAFRHRGLATALLDIEPRLRKVMGYRPLSKLRDALKRELKIDTTTSKEEAA